MISFKKVSYAAMSDFHDTLTNFSNIDEFSSHLSERFKDDYLDYDFDTETELLIEHAHTGIYLNDTLVGLISYTHEATLITGEPSTNLSFILIHPEHRQKGFARAAVNRVIVDSPNKHMEVLFPCTQESQELFWNIGFRQNSELCRQFENYYKALTPLTCRSIRKEDWDMFNAIVEPRKLSYFDIRCLEKIQDAVEDLHHANYPEVDIFVYGIWIEGKLAGAAKIIFAEKDRETGTVDSLFVLPEYRRRKLASKLLQTLWNTHSIKQLQAVPVTDEGRFLLMLLNFKSDETAKLVKTRRI